MLTLKRLESDIFSCNNKLYNVLIILFGSLIGIVEIYIIGQFDRMTIIYTIVLSVGISFFCGHGNRIISALHLEIMPWDKNPPLKVFYLFLLNGIYTSGIITIGVLSFHYIINLIPKYYLLKSLGWGIFGGMLISLLINSIFISIYFFNKWKESLVETERLKRESIQSELNSLRNQVNPHFLFNSLNTLTSIIAEDQDKAIDFVQNFSDLYRYILKSQEREVSTLEDELHATNIYLQLQKERFEDKIQVEIDIPKDKMNMFLPTLTLQMLVENCIKHNIASNAKPLKIDFFVENKRLVVQNNFQKKQTLPISTGLGLKNIRKRYDLLSNQKVEIMQSDELFKISIPLLVIVQKN